MKCRLETCHEALQLHTVANIRGPAAAHRSEAGGLFAHLYFTLTSTDSRYTRPKHVRTLLSFEPCSFLLLDWSQFMEAAHRLAAAQMLVNTSEVKLV